MEKITDEEVFKSLSKKLHYWGQLDKMAILEEDIKEFIKILLEEAKMHDDQPMCLNGITWTELIKSKAGSKLSS